MYSISSLVATGIILPLLGVVAVGLRFHVRLRSKTMAPGLDDWTMLAACVIVCGIGSLQIIGENIWHLALSTLKNQVLKSRLQVLN